MLYECWETQGKKNAVPGRPVRARRGVWLYGREEISGGINVVLQMTQPLMPPQSHLFVSPSSVFSPVKKRKKKKTSSRSLICEVSIATLVASMISSVNFPTDCLTK